MGAPISNRLTASLFSAARPLNADERYKPTGGRRSDLASPGVDPGRAEIAEPLASR